MVIRDEIKKVRQRRYVDRDFDGFKAQLLTDAKQNYPDRIKDFSEASLGGMFLDFAAAVGDNLSFYLDHQFGELDFNTVVEPANAERILRQNGIEPIGAAPATVICRLYVKVPALNTGDGYIPDSASFPRIHCGSTVFESTDGILFTLIRDIATNSTDYVDFSATKTDGSLYAQYKVGDRSATGVPQNFIMTLEALAVSGEDEVETFTIGSTFVPFRRITLGNASISQIIAVYDDLGNTYYQVDALTQDVVYKNVLNTSGDSDVVPEAIKVVLAPYRFMVETDIETRESTLIFGGGSADTLEDDVIPDPTEFAISLPFKTTFSRSSINPYNLLNTKTLGVASTNTTLTVKYRHGGGLTHNISATSLRNVKTLVTTFPNAPAAGVASSVRSSIEVDNEFEGKGGDDPPTVDEMLALVPSVNNAQKRIVAREDVISHIYKMPSNFGRVFRVGVRQNPYNPDSTLLYVVSRNADKHLRTSPDSLKNNIIKYLKTYRITGDSYEILDSPVVNYTVKFDVSIDSGLNKESVLATILKSIRTILDVQRFHIDQPIVLSEIRNRIFSVNGVISINDIRCDNITGVIGNRTYNSYIYDMQNARMKDFILPPPGGIFELRYSQHDIIGRAS